MKKLFLIPNTLILVFLAIFLQFAHVQKVQALNLFGSDIPDSAKKVLEWTKSNASRIQTSMARKDMFFEKVGVPRSIYSKSFAKSELFQFYPYPDVITRSPIYTKDFQKLYFLVTDSTYTKTHLLFIPAVGEPEYVFTYDGNFRYYDISPDGKEIIFSTMVKSAIMRYSITSKKLTTEMDSSVGAQFPNYSPLGDSFVYSGNNEKKLWIRNLKTGVDSILVDDAMMKELPKFSPNGAYITYQGWSGSNTDSFDIYKVEVYSKKVTRLTSNPQLDANPSFDRTSQWIIYITTPLHSTAGNQICITDLDGMNTVIDPNSLPKCWFPVF